MERIIENYIDKIQEKTNPDDVNLSSFKVNQELNPKIWDSNNQIKPEIRVKLLNIAEDFVDFLEIPWIEYKDITITGSLANYNWSKYSDIDLHVIINRNDIDDNMDLVDNFLSAKKNLWNDLHDIKIYGFDVELYAQDTDEAHTSTGVYSLEDNKWLIKPKKESHKLDKPLIKRKASAIMDKIDDLKKLNVKGEHQKVIDNYEKLWDGIKKMRQIGLDRSGEFSYENIVFKVLRRTNYLEKLMDLKNDSYDKIKSL